MWGVGAAVRRTNLVIAAASATVGVLALAITLAAGEVFALGTALGVVLLVNALVRYRLAQRR